MDEQKPERIEHPIAPEKIAELKKNEPNLYEVKFTISPDDVPESMAGTWQMLFRKPGPLVARKYFNNAAEMNLYEAARLLALETLVFPDKDTLSRLMDECPDLPIELNGQLRPLVQKIKSANLKKV